MEMIMQRSFILKRAAVEWDTAEVYGCGLIPSVGATALPQTELTALRRASNCKKW
jgi:hypothetical protein